MLRPPAPFSLILASLLLAACGVSEQRVGALEGQIQKIKEASAQGDTGPQIVALQERVDTLEKSSVEGAEKTGAMLEVLQREVTRLANEPKVEPTTEPSPWDDVDAILGLSGDGVSETGEGQYTIKRLWAWRELRAMALDGDGVKLGEGKGGGVSFKGVKPKSLLGQLGFKNNDEVLAINDKAIAAPADISAALRAAASPTVVKLKRKKKDLTFTYTLAD